jgi:hypothetical protein
MLMISIVCGVEAMSILLFTLLLFPITAGVALLFVGRSVEWVRRYAGLAVTALAFVCSLGLLFFGEQDVHVPVTWIPGAGAWSLHIGGLGLTALIVTLGSALVTRIVTLVAGTECTPELDAIFLIALGAGSMAFLTGHFLARYLALEIVALCVAAACLIHIRSEAGTQAAGFVYLLLRVGDAGLLASILLLLGIGDTLDVGEALQVGIGLRGLSLAWVVGGFSLAVWVKAGAWPFHGWQRVGVTHLPAAAAWLYGTLMPQLGLYLLYRVTPLMALGGIITLVLLVLGLGSSVVTVVLWLRAARSATSLQVYGGALLGSLGIAFAALGSVAGVSTILIAGVLFRLGMALWRMARASSPEFAVAGVLDSSVVMQGTLGRGLVGTVRSFMSGAQVLHDTVEQGVFEQGPTMMGHAVMDGARALHTSVEQGGLDSLLHGTARMVVALSRSIQRVHTGKLRTGMLWVVLSLLAVILLVRAP